MDGIALVRLALGVITDRLITILVQIAGLAKNGVPGLEEELASLKAALMKKEEQA